MEFDLDKLAGELSTRMGSQVGSLIGDLVQEKLQGMGLSDVDRKHGMFPGIPGADDSGPAARTPAQRAKAFLRSAILHSDMGEWAGADGEQETIPSEESPEPT